MLENITLGQISMAVVFIGGLIGGIRYLKTSLKDFLKTLLKDQFKTVNDKLDAMQAAIDTVDTQACKNYIVRYLADIEREDFIFEPEKQRFWEEYDHYIKDLNENSYVKEWVEKLQKEGKL